MREQPADRGFGRRMPSFAGPGLDLGGLGKSLDGETAPNAWQVGESGSCLGLDIGSIFPRQDA